MSNECARFEGLAIAYGVSAVSLAIWVAADLANIWYYVGGSILLSAINTWRAIRA
jgi:hypothetical protein